MSAALRLPPFRWAPPCVQAKSFDIANLRFERSARAPRSELRLTSVVASGNSLDDEPYHGRRKHEIPHFRSDVQNGNNNYPFAGPNTIEAAEWHAHPLFTESAFFLHDVGVILLKKAFNLAAAQYGRLPTKDQLDALQPSSSTLFTAVGYGLQKINPVFVVAEKIRMNAQPHLVQINTPGLTGDFSLLLSNNASTGGTCFGDSGGPNYLGTSNVVAGVTSFGLNGTCGGTGGVFRLDRQNVLDFVTPFLN